MSHLTDVWPQTTTVLLLSLKHDKEPLTRLTRGNQRYQLHYRSISGACRRSKQTRRHAPSEYLVLHKHTLRVYKHTLLVQTHPTVTTMPYGHSLGNRAKLCTMTAHSDLLTETYMQTAGEMMNLRESVDLRGSELGSENAC